MTAATQHDRRSKGAPDGRPAAGDPRPPTLKDVAAIAGVDVSLVSRVVNRDQKLSILPATRERIMAAVQQTGYRPNVQARGLRTARTFTIGFLLPRVGNPIYDPIVAGAMRRAAESGYLIVLGGSVEAAYGDRPFENLLLERRVDGLIVASGEIGDASLRDLAAGGSPIVFANRRVSGVAGSVVVDDAEGARLATSHLIELGHRRLAHLEGPTGIDTAGRRRDGFLAAASAAGLPVALVEAAGYDAEGGRQAATSTLLRDPSITGMVAANMHVAIGAMRAIADAGLRVPEDVSVIAIHDHPMAAYLRPALSCVLLPLAELGAAAADLVLRRVEGEPARDVMVTGEIRLVQRESTALPPSPAR